MSLSLPVVLSLLSSLILVVLSSDTTAEASAMAHLRQAVEAYTRPLDATWKADEMRVAWADLDNDGLQDALVHLTGSAWCGSGGCTLLIFAAVDSVDVHELGAYTALAEINLVHGPLVIAEEQTNGWRDLVVEATEGSWRRLAFDGETYPFSPADGVAVRSPPGGPRVAFDDV